MSSVFLDLINISITASWIVLAVVILRLVLRKMPKWITCLLWGIVALRLLIPIHFESTFSLIPSAEVIPQDIVTTQTPAINSGIPVMNNVVNPILAEQAVQEVNLLERVLHYGSLIWAAGVVLMLLYSIISSLRLHLQVRASILMQKNVYFCDDVDFPFVLGVFWPKIYLPSGMNEVQIGHVLAHENAHLKRKDHWWKPLGFLLLTVYWFNPLLWLAYVLVCRDIEQACDEKVVATMDNTGKKGYSETLAACSMQRRMIMACPVAFGEVAVKTRIKGILHYKKPALWIILASVAACSVAAACLLTDPFSCIHEYHGQIVMASTCTKGGKETLTCAKCQHSYTKNIGMHAHSYDEGVVTLEPTCIATGTRLFTCIDCGAQTTQSIGFAPHTAGELTVTVEPHCSQKGEVTSVCSVCNETFVAQILETNDVHDLKETVLKAATCITAGEGVINCTRCSYEQKCIYDLLAHQYEVSVVDEATCRSAAQYRYTCVCCNHTYHELGSFGGHNWVSYTWDQKWCSHCGFIVPKSTSNDPWGINNNNFPGQPYFPVISIEPELPIIPRPVFP